MAKKPTAIPILPIATAIAKALARSGASKTVAKSGVGKFLSKPRFFVPKTTPKVTGKPGGVKKTPTEVARTKAGEQRARDRSRWPETVVAKNKRPADLKTLVKEKKLKSDVEKILLRQKRERYGPR